MHVPGNDYLHLLHIVVDIAVFRVLSLDVLDQLALLSDHMGDFLEVLKMVRSELLLLLHNVVDLFVEGQEVLVGHCLALTRVKGHTEIVQFCLTMLWCLPVACSRAWTPGATASATGCVPLRTSVWPLLRSRH